MADEIGSLGIDAHRLLKRAGTVIDSKLPQARRDGILTSQTKLHLAKLLDKYLTTRKTEWNARQAQKN